MGKKDELFQILSKRLREVFMALPLDYEKLQEIRLRIQVPVLLYYENREYGITHTGALQEMKTKLGQVDLIMISREEMEEMVAYMSHYSLYAFEEQIRQGYFTVQGGHRIGVLGKAVIEQGRIKWIDHISYINIRISHQKKGCADFVLPYIWNKTQKELWNTLIISPPKAGKTTLLRDMIRQLSNGSKFHSGLTVGVVDERSELAACYCGVAQNDVGIRTDVLDACPKAKGMFLLVRSMSPQVIAVDEIGLLEDVAALQYVIRSGCHVIASVHASSFTELKEKPAFRKVIKEQIFQRYIVLSANDGVGTIQTIIDQAGHSCYERNETC